VFLRNVGFSLNYRCYNPESRTLHSLHSVCNRVTPSGVTPELHNMLRKWCSISWTEPFSLLWHVDPLLGNDREMSDYTTAVAK
jgi:hypothetical protein